MVAVNGPQTMSVYATVMSAMGGGLPAYMNKSLGSLMEWIYYGRIFTTDAARTLIVNQPQPFGFLLAVKAASGAFYLYCLFLAWRGHHQLDRASKAAIIAIFGLVTACVSPISWRHSYCIAFIALAIFWVRALRTPSRVLHVVLLTLTTFTLGSLFFDLASQAPLPQPIKICLAATWIVFCILFCLDVLFHASVDSHAFMAED